MNRSEFMKELEYLLQDIPDPEKEEALAYYRDYLEDAGDEHEEQVIREFGSPERVAAIIRSDLNGNIGEGGEFTESGYRDERFREPNFQVAKRQDLPETQKDERQNAEGGTNREKCQQDLQDRTWLKRVLKVGLLLVILGVLSPLILGIGGSVFGILTGVVCVAIVLILCVGVLTAVACIVGVALLVAGVGLLFNNVWSGLLLLGAGVFALGLGLIGIAVSVLVYGQFLPYIIQMVVNGISNFIHRERRKA